MGETRISEEPQGLTSRRNLLAGAATAIVAASAPLALAKSPPVEPMMSAEAGLVPTNRPIRGYMSASALLPDGRILITGGFDQPWTDSRAPLALRSAWIFNANSGQVIAASPMLTPRARHAAVALRDGRVAIIGGMNQGPIASVEVYDPRFNRWEFAEPLAYARYDHTAVTDGTNIVVIGGSSQSAVSAVEMFNLDYRVQNTPVP